MRLLLKMLIYSGCQTSRNGVTISVDWYDQSKGLILWTLTNPTSDVISVSINRGQSELGIPPYFFGDAYWGTYVAAEIASFLDGPPTPMSGNLDELANPVPLGLLFTPVGFGPAFIFTVAANSSVSLVEGGFLSDEGTEISTTAQLANILEVIYVGTLQMTASFSASENCEYSEPCASSPYSRKTACFITSEVPISAGANILGTFWPSASVSYDNLSGFENLEKQTSQYPS